MVKYAHLTESISRQAGGLFDAVMRLAQSEQNHGAKVKVFGLRDASTEVDSPAWRPVSTAVFPRGWPNGIGTSPGFLSELKAFEPDICHTHGLWLYPSIAAKRYGLKFRRPYIVSPHGMLDPWALKNSRWKKFIAWYAFEAAHLKGAHCLRALCQSEADSIRKLGLKNEIVVVPNGVDLPSGSSDVTPPWREFITSEKKVLLFLSRIHPKKGLVNLLRAWSQIHDPNWILAIAGWDQTGHEAELKNLCSEQNIVYADIRQPPALANFPPTVLFLGPQFKAAKMACYHHCHAFILPSFSEGLPMVVLEAWANARPVLMTPECNLPEGFIAGAAIKIEPNAISIAAGLKNLFAMSNAERKAMGRRARTIVEFGFTWEKVGRQMHDVYGWALGGSPKPNCLLHS